MTEPNKRPTLKLKLPVKASPLPTKLQIEVPAAKNKEPALIKTPQEVAPPKKLLMPQEEYTKLLGELRTKYPALFAAKKVKILAIGIHKEVQAELGWGGNVTRKFFTIFCGAKKYKEARVKGAKRYNLKGEVVGKVE